MGGWGQMFLSVLLTSSLLACRTVPDTGSSPQQIFMNWLNRQIYHHHFIIITLPHLPVTFMASRRSDHKIQTAPKTVIRKVLYTPFTPICPPLHWVCPLAPRACLQFPNVPGSRPPQGLWTSWILDLLPSPCRRRPSFLPMSVQMPPPLKELAGSPYQKQIPLL